MSCCTQYCVEDTLGVVFIAIYDSNLGTTVYVDVATGVAGTPTGATTVCADGSIQVATVSFTSTNGVLVNIGDEYIQLPNGDTWADNPDCCLLAWCITDSAGDIFTAYVVRDATGALTAVDYLDNLTGAPGVPVPPLTDCSAALSNVITATAAFVTTNGTTINIGDQFIQLDSGDTWASPSGSVITAPVAVTTTNNADIFIGQQYVELGNGDTWYPQVDSNIEVNSSGPSPRVALTSLSSTPFGTTVFPSINLTHTNVNIDSPESILFHYNVNQGYLTWTGSNNHNYFLTLRWEARINGLLVTPAFSTTAEMIYASQPGPGGIQSVPLSFGGTLNPLEGIAAASIDTNFRLLGGNTLEVRYQLTHHNFDDALGTYNGINGTTPSPGSFVEGIKIDGSISVAGGRRVA